MESTSKTTQSVNEKQDYLVSSRNDVLFNLKSDNMHSH